MDRSDELSGVSGVSDTEELARLRGRVAELEAESRAGAPEGQRGTTRAFAASVLISMACILAPVAVVSVWAGTVISSTDGYVETVAPLINDPGVQSAIADEVTAAIMERLDVEGLTTGALEALAQQENMPSRIADGLPALALPLARGIEDFTRTETGDLVASHQFETVWAEVNRTAHAQVITLLEGNDGGAITAQHDQITLNLGPVVEQVRARLVTRGFTAAARVPTVDRSFVLAESPALGQAQRAYTVLNVLGAWLPFVAVALFAAGVLLARDRRRALLRGSLGVAAAMVALGVGLSVVRILYVETTPVGVLTAESAGTVFDTLVSFLRTGLRATAVLALLVALAAFGTGPSPTALRARTLLSQGVGAAAGGTDAAGGRLEALGAWVYRHRGALRLTAFLSGGLTLMFWSRPTAWDVVLVVVAVALALAVIAFLGRPPATASLSSAAAGADRGAPPPGRSDDDVRSPQKDEAIRSPRS